MHLVLLAGCLCVTATAGDVAEKAGGSFNVIKQWKSIEFDKTCKPDTGNATYDPTHNIITGIKVYQDMMFLSIPALYPGVPVSLAYINLYDSTMSPHLKPFPTWEYQTKGDCNALQTVEGFEIDNLGYMWVIDDGSINTLSDEPSYKCPPKLVIFDLKTMKQVSTGGSTTSQSFRHDPCTKIDVKVERTYIFPSDVVPQKGSFLNDLVLDKDGSDHHAYITDSGPSDPGIVVYSLKKNKSWKIRNDRTMKGQPGFFKVDGTVLQFRKDGNVNGIALCTIDKRVFYCPLASKHIYSISTELLKRENVDPNEVERDIIDEGTKSSITDGMMMDSKSNLYFGLQQNNAVAKWNKKNGNLQTSQIIAKDDNQLIWPDTFAISAGNLFFTTSKGQQFLVDEIDINVVNFRIFQGYIGECSYTTNTGGSSSEKGKTNRPMFPSFYPLKTST